MCVCVCIDVCVYDVTQHAPEPLLVLVQQRLVATVRAGHQPLQIRRAERL
jgi:hypothetical protein